MPKYKIKFEVETGGPSESAEIMHLFAVLPFIPRKGMKIVAVKGDDYRVVDEVYWSVTDGFTVYFEFSHWRVKDMKKHGWKI